MNREHKRCLQVAGALSSSGRAFASAIEANNPDDIQTAIHVVAACLAEMQEIQNLRNAGLVAEIQRERRDQIIREIEDEKLAHWRDHHDECLDSTDGN